MKSKFHLFLVLSAMLWTVQLPAQTNSSTMQPSLIPEAACVPATRDSPKNWMSRHEKFVAQAKRGGIDILFMGDSITDNWRSKGSNVWNEDYAPRHAANF
ncbi:MAG TPA: hypothetical protein VGJ73_03000, partial [Verrucomicrobiae bacterium]